jgi:DNA-binding NarL/FixJ family response regulator
MNFISLLIVDDHPVVQQGLQYLLHSCDDIKVMGSFSFGKEALQFLKFNKVDVVLLDVNLPDIHGIEMCREIKKIQAKTYILALSNHSERSLITQMVHSGASGYMLKNASSDELIQAIRDVMQGKLAFNQQVQKILLQAASPEFSEIPQLTRREKEILQRIATGMTTAQIADELFISPLTVESHRRNLMQKFKVDNAPALIKVAAQYRLV